MFERKHSFIVSFSFSEDFKPSLKLLKEYAELRNQSLSAVVEEILADYVVKLQPELKLLYNAKSKYLIENLEKYVEQIKQKLPSLTRRELLRAIQNLSFKILDVEKISGSELEIVKNAKEILQLLEKRFYEMSSEEEARIQEEKFREFLKQMSGGGENG